MQGVAKGLPKRKKVRWSLNEANEEGIPWRIPYLVILFRYKAGKPFKVKFAINASIAFSMNPQQIFAPSLKPIPLSDGMQLIPTWDDVDQYFTPLDLKRLTKTSFKVTYEK